MFSKPEVLTTTHNPCPTWGKWTSQALTPQGYLKEEKKSRVMGASENKYVLFTGNQCVIKWYPKVTGYSYAN